MSHMSVIPYFLWYKISQFYKKLNNFFYVELSQNPIFLIRIFLAAFTSLSTTRSQLLQWYISSPPTSSLIRPHLLQVLVVSFSDYNDNSWITSSLWFPYQSLLEFKMRPCYHFPCCFFSNISCLFVYHFLCLEFG